MRRTVLKTVSRLALVAASGLALTSSNLALAQAWPPAVSPVLPSTRPLSPADELKTIVMAPGYRAELAAAEPLVDNPAAMSWDYDGRLWVTEYPPWMENGAIDGSTMFNPTSRISVLEDTNGDGVFDKKTVFADKLVLPRSVLVLGPGHALVHEPKGVFRMRDTNGDGVADTKEEVLGSFGARGGDVEHTGNGLFWAIDNTIYNSEIGLAMKWKGGKLVPILAASSGQYGITQDDYGHLFRQTNSSAPIVSYLSDAYYARNPQFVRKRGIAEWMGGPSRDANVVWPIRPNPGQNRAYSANFLRADGTAREYTAAGGLGLYRGTAMPELRGDIFSPEAAANLIVRSKLQDNGSGLSLRRAYEKGEFMASTDERFRPVYISAGPDGALYVADMYTGVIQSTGFITNYLAGYIRKNGLDVEGGPNGRIFRITHEGAKLANPSPALSKATPQQLVDALASPDGWRRDMAQRWLVIHDVKAAVPLLGRLLQTSRDPIARLHALWTLDGLDAVTPAQVLAGLKDPSRDVRAASIRIGERWLGDANSPVAKAVVALVGHTDNDWAVQYQLAASAGALADAQRIPTILRIADTYGDDWIALDAALQGLKPADVGPAFKQLLDGTARLEWSQAREQALTTLAATILRYGSQEEVAGLLAAIASDATPAWQRTALVTGGEVVLLGQRDPGQAPALPSGNYGSLTVPDGSGNSAFPKFVAEKNAAASVGNAEFAAAYPQLKLPPSAMKSVGGAPTLVLAAEPAPLTAFAAGTGGDARLRTRTKALLDLIVWPGKPGYVAQ